MSWSLHSWDMYRCLKIRNFRLKFRHLEADRAPPLRSNRVKEISNLFTHFLCIVRFGPRHCHSRFDTKLLNLNTSVAIWMVFGEECIWLRPFRDLWSPAALCCCTKPSSHREMIPGWTKCTPETRPGKQCEFCIHLSFIFYFLHKCMVSF